MRVLLIEDSPRLSEYVSRGLRRAGFAVDVALDGEEGQFLADSGEHDVIVLDRLLPGKDGMAILRALRERGSDVHVLMLTAKDTVEDRVAGLQEGADDYLIKPFAFEELLARVQALARRAYGVKKNVLAIGPLAIDLTQRTAARDGELLALRPREYALLEYLALRAGELVTRTDIERHIYDEQAEPMSNVVDSAICSLRKLVDAPGADSLITTRRGQGYVFGIPET
ncbi:MAG: response regulator [Candidatus Hydrogenedens sp.]|nr:response regulator [Candidatus Hydrogenedens sp.]